MVENFLDIIDGKNAQDNLYSLMILGPFCAVSLALLQWNRADAKTFVGDTYCYFAGCVLALQSATSLQQFGAVSMTGRLVSLSMMKELGPVLTGLMVSGRNASGMASELGSMKVTEQIDAMRALGVDPVRKLVTPRVTATVFMLFWLTILSDAVGVAGGGLVSVFMLGLNGTSYFHSTYRALVYGDVVQGMAKPIFFGFIISTIGCYFGMSTKGGTQGVGRATTQAVVVSSVFIIVVDFLISRVTIGIFGR